MGLANRAKTLISQELDKSTGMFPFEDRVLIWMAPHWQKEIETFHCSTGVAMNDDFDGHQLSKFDQHYLQTLKDKLQKTLRQGALHRRRIVP
jgi:hypothetical protein